MAEPPPHISVFVATPCYGGLLSAHYTNAVLALQRACDSRGIGLHVALAGGDALIARVRSMLATRFLEETDHTHLLFIDADIGFQPEQVFRLLEAGRDLVGGVYPTKRVNWAAARRAVEGGFKDLEAASLNYVVQYAHDAAQGVRLQDGFAPVTYVGTGFLLVSRHVLETLKAAHPELRARIGDVGLSAREVTMFFETMIEPDTRQYLSEDYAFCRRWRDCGGEIWADLSSRLTHVGAAAFTGSVIDSSTR